MLLGLTQCSSPVIIVINITLTPSEYVLSFLTAMAPPTDPKYEDISGLLLAIESWHQPYQLSIREKDKDLDATALHQAETHICFMEKKKIKRRNK